MVWSTQRLPSLVCRMSLSTNSILNLTLCEARQLFSDSSYKAFTKALGRPRRAYDSHVIVRPLEKQHVLTCRVVGTDRYIPFSKVITRTKPYQFLPELRRKALTRGRFAAVVTHMDPESQYPVDVHYDVMSTDKQNIVTVSDLVDMLSVYSEAGVSLLDCVRLYFLQHPHLFYFTSSLFVERSESNVTFLRQLTDVVECTKARGLCFPEESVQANTFFRTLYRRNMLSALDTGWIPEKAIKTAECYLKDMKTMARRGKIPEELLLDCVKELCIYLHPFVPDTAGRLWATLQQTDNPPNQEVSEQPWPLDLSALDWILDTKFCSENGYIIEEKSFILHGMDMSSFTAKAAKSFICNSRFYKDRFKQENRVKDISLMVGKHGRGYNAKITILRST